MARKSREKKISDAKNIEKCFNAWDRGEPDAPIVRDKNGLIIEKLPNEKFLRCTDPYPKSYYISDQGRLISFENPRSPRLKDRKIYYEKDEKRYGYEYVVHKNGRPYMHQVNNKKVAKRDTKPVAKIILDTWQAHGMHLENSYGFARKEEKYPDVKMNMHHEEGKENNNPASLGKVTEHAHYIVIQYAQRHPRNERTEEQEQELEDRLYTLAEIENPDGYTILIDDIGKVGLRDIRDEKSLDKFLDDESKLLLLLSKKASCINHYFYHYHETISDLLYPCIIWNTKAIGKADPDSRDVVFYKFASYNREEYGTQITSRGYVKPCFIEYQENLRASQLQNMFEFIVELEKNIAQISCYTDYLNDLIEITYEKKTLDT